MQRLVMHVDMDAFFASVEQRDHPEYRRLPVVVGALPGNRGVVATCSYEARRYGVHSAMPISEAARRLPPETVYLRPRMSAYAEASRQIMAALETISPLVEPVSIDEAYVDVSGLERLFGPPEAIAERTRQAIRDATGLTASIGIGPNRLIAKLASDRNKPAGLTVVREEEVLDFLAPMPVSNLRGVGRKTLARLQDLSVRTVADLRERPLTLLARHLAPAAASHLHDQARGIASDRVEPDQGRKSISKETTFNRDQDDPELLRETLQWAATEVGYLARREGLKGRVVTLKIRLENFETHTRQRRLDAPTDADKTILRTALALYRESGLAGRRVRLIGCGISGWEDEAETPQADLFAEGADAPAGGSREEKLYATLDRISEKFGRGSVKLGIARKRH